MGNSKPSVSPVIVASKVSIGSGRRSSILLFLLPTIRLVVARVSQNSSSGGSKSGSVRRLSAARASVSSVPSRTALRSSTIRSSPCWRNTVVSSTSGNVSVSKEWAEKKNGVPKFVSIQPASASVTTGGS